MSKSSLTFLSDARGDTLSLSLIGQIDAGADYSSVSFDGIKKVSFNLKGITLINSTGIQKWVKFMESIPSGIDISFEECPTKIVNQCNLFANFFGGKKVHFKSFMAPYYCEKCDKDSEELLTHDEVMGSGSLKIPEKKCADGGCPKEFDGIEDKYFQFLKR